MPFCYWALVTRPSRHCFLILVETGWSAKWGDCCVGELPTVQWFFCSFVRTLIAFFIPRCQDDINGLFSCWKFLWITFYSTYLFWIILFGIPSRHFILLLSSVMPLCPSRTATCFSDCLSETSHKFIYPNFYPLSFLYLKTHLLSFSLFSITWILIKSECNHSLCYEECLWLIHGLKASWKVTLSLRFAMANSFLHWLSVILNFL